MTTKDIAVNGQVFHCPVEWTVDRARYEIRSWYCLQGGGIVVGEDMVPVPGDRWISSLAGTLAFVRLSEVSSHVSVVTSHFYPHVTSFHIHPTDAAAPAGNTLSDFIYHIFGLWGNPIVVEVLSFLLHILAKGEISSTVI